MSEETIVFLKPVGSEVHEIVQEIANSLRLLDDQSDLCLLTKHIDDSVLCRVVLEVRKTTEWEFKDSLTFVLENTWKTAERLYIFQAKTSDGIWLYRKKGCDRFTSNYAEVKNLRQMQRMIRSEITTSYDKEVKRILVNIDGPAPRG